MKLLHYFNNKRFYKSVSPFSFWDKATKFSNKVYIAHGVRLGNVTIGDYSRIRHFSTIYYTNIGKFTAIGTNARIGIGQHPTNLLSTNLIFYKKNPIHNKWVRPISFDEYKLITIGNDVWIGESVMIMGGISIGDGAIVAARSVVTKDVPPYAIVAGIPARIVKYRFDEIMIQKLLKLKWWNLSDSEIEKNIDAFTINNIQPKQIQNFFNV